MANGDRIYDIDSCEVETISYERARRIALRLVPMIGREAVEAFINAPVVTDKTREVNDQLAARLMHLISQSQ